MKLTWLNPRKNAARAAASPGACASLELLYRHHYSWLLGQVRRRFGPDQAEDVVQETYARAAAYQGKEVRNPRALLLQIARNVAIDMERRRAARPVTLGLDEDEAQTLAVQTEALVLKQLILQLPPHLRDVFVLSRFAGLTYEEIAERLGIAVKTVEWRMNKALKAISRDLNR